ncbi:MULTISPECIES: outer membrane protein [unclassified Duganella]|jgi:opacity protein-like surface antigen|uniref:outer membrane protein n=1 Tax=unclassified Duganella TaxID=2636909 RepID=UPI000883407E|nr:MULTISPECIES: outer membrane beta-barrel protein [unclassified Duganella]SDG96449.1 Outer membrane protein beta-barrel domain-containing protein [Duganella sp. OV458]SDJ45887.1 Outer membrane protein beta-barrel domain-containing protein [Duganella sp. OV510]
MKAVHAALISLAAVAGVAGAAEQSPWYVGADVGAQTSRAHGPSGRAYVGYELGSGLRDPEQRQSVEVAVFTRGLEDRGQEARANSIAINWATLLKVTDNFSVSGRLGAHYTTSTIRHSAQWSETEEKPGVFAGVGVAYQLTPRILITTDATYMPLHVTERIKSKTPTVTIGLRYGF